MPSRGVPGLFQPAANLKILILKPSSLGDVVHALPVLRLLKLHLPQSRIYWWLESSLVPLLADDPDLAGVIPFERRHWSSPGAWPGILANIRATRQERFDWAIDLQGLARSAFTAWLAGADLSIGLNNEREGAREGARLFYDVIAPPAKPRTHAVDRYLAVLPLLGVPVHGNFNWLPERPRIAQGVRVKWRPEGRRWVALLPGARWESKCWPIEHFCDLARRLLPLADDLSLAILGGNNDRALGAAVAAVDPQRCLDLTGRTSLMEMIEWLRLSELVITNDTGPMHIAAALHRPIIALFGPTDPSGTGPYGQRENVLQTVSLPCVPCMNQHCHFDRPLACLRDITPQTVCQTAATRLLKK